jgi:GNAT superfamily N-acetyltransferase
MTTTKFEVGYPEMAPAAELLAEMSVELGVLYWDASRLDRPKLTPTELRAPAGTYLVGWQDTDAVAGGGVRPFADGLGEIKRMFVRPDFRSQGIAGALLAALEDAARALGYRAVRLDTGPKQLHALQLYRGAGYEEIAPYNDNPFACFWGEKALV